MGPQQNKMSIFCNRLASNQAVNLRLSVELEKLLLARVTKNHPRRVHFKVYLVVHEGLGAFLCSNSEKIMNSHSKAILGPLMDKGWTLTLWGWLLWP